MVVPQVKQVPNPKVQNKTKKKKKEKAKRDVRCY